MYGQNSKFVGVSFFGAARSHTPSTTPAVLLARHSDDIAFDAKPQCRLWGFVFSTWIVFIKDYSKWISIGAICHCIAARVKLPVSKTLICTRLQNSVAARLVWADKRWFLELHQKSTQKSRASKMKSNLSIEAFQRSSSSATRCPLIWTLYWLQKKNQTC